MKSSEVKAGRTYRVKVSGKLTDVRITGVNPYGGWDGINLETNRKVRIQSAGRLRRCSDTGAKKTKVMTKAEYEAGAAADDARPRGKKTTKAAKDARPAAKADTGERGATGGDAEAKPMSLLDAAAHLLSLGAGDLPAGQAGPMRCQTIVDLAVARGLWTPRSGKTPANTLYAAISREIKLKGDDARFRKAERGKFELNR